MIGLIEVCKIEGREVGVRVSFAVVLVSLLLLGCSPTAPASVSSGPPPCTPARFYKPRPHTALLGYRCGSGYAAADESLYNGRGQLDAHLFVARHGRWVDTVSGSGGLFIRSRDIRALGLDAQEIARSLGLSLLMIGPEQVLHVDGLGCDWRPS